MKRVLTLLMGLMLGQGLSITTGVIGRDPRFLLSKPSQVQIDSLRREAHNGNTQAQMAMVEYFQLIQLQPDSARFYLKLAVQAGQPEAQYLLGLMFLRGVEGPKRPAEGLRLLEEAARKGYILAMRVLYEVLEPPDSVSPLSVQVLPYDARRAFRWALQAAELGDLPSMLKVAQYYMKGKGTSRNDSLAHTWLLQAAEKGYLPAQTHLAEWYAYKELKPDRARHWAEKILAHPHAPAEDQVRARVALYYADLLPTWLPWFRHWILGTLAFQK
ncbi:MAG: tetratricopeptide repeat protein [Bacteroidia bacterium]|nr:sel1 repeat family protein [Bacteroidia bacterium]MDW8015499.1 tetratricopeptide repeat protein [Bacteroidia bacterium]